MLSARQLPTIVVILAATCGAMAQNDWVRQSPLPYPPPADFPDIAFATAERGYIVGATEGGPLETTDGGATWHGINLGDGSFNDVFFLDSDHGWLVENNNNAYRTTDGGESWQQMVNFPAGSYYDIEFITPQDGRVIGNGCVAITHDGGQSWFTAFEGDLCIGYADFATADLALGLRDNVFDDEPPGIYRSTNGGTNWDLVFPSDEVTSIRFLDEQVALALIGGSIHRSDDGGEDWTEIEPGPGDAGAILIFDPDTALVVDAPNAKRTTDGGLTWASVSLPFDFYYLIRVVSDTTAIVADAGGNIYTSTDQGATWGQTHVGIGFPLWGVGFGSGDVGYSVGAGGVILRTDDGGLSWSHINHGLATELTDIEMWDSQRGLAVAGGIMLRTTDGGDNWTLVVTGLGNMEEVTVVGSNTAYAAGSGIIKSTDGGLTWELLPVPQDAGSIFDIHFVNETTGWFGGLGPIFKTTDGGQTWENQIDNVLCYAMDFHDENLGIFAGSSGVIFRTTNGGDDWFDIPVPSGSTLTGVEFASEDIVYISGFAYMIKSTDGGVFWESQSLPTEYGTSDIEARTEDEVWVAGYHLMHTTDGGASWQQVIPNVPGGDQLGRTGVHIDSPGNVWVSDFVGGIFHLPGDSVQAAALTDFAVVDGSLIDGSLDDLTASDELSVHTRSEIGFTAFEPNVMDMVVGATSPLESDDADTINLSIESRINHPIGEAKVRLRDWTTNQFEQVDSYEIGTTEEVVMIEGVDATDHIRADESRIELSLRHVVIATFTASGFDSFFDHVEITVQE